MRVSHPEELLSVLLETATSKGHRITIDQLHRWQQFGALPSPRQRGIGRGSQVLYPSGTTAQLLALCALLARDRSLVRVRWRLWWQGFAVSDAHARAFLTAELDTLLSRKKALETDASTDTDDAAADTAMKQREAAYLSRDLDPVLRRIRKRTGRRDFPILAQRSHEAAVGLFEGWPEAEDAGVVAKGLGLTNSRDYSGKDGARRFAETYTSALRAFSHHSDPEVLRESLEAASDDELRAARDELRALLSLRTGLVRLAESVVGVGPAQRIVAPILDELATEPVGHSLLLWLRVRASVPAQQVYSGFLALANAVEQGASLTDADAIFAGTRNA